MQRRKQRTWRWVARPQALALVAACLVLITGLSLTAMSKVVTPAATASKPPVIRPVAHAAPVPAMVREPRKPDCARQPCLALSFDDGPDRDFTPRILDTLARHNVRATFFVTGLHAQRHPDLIKREFTEGHEVGNHSWDHADFTKLNAVQIQSEISQTQRAIVDAGVPAPTLFRPPYGAVNEVVLANVPLTIIRWNIDPEDWKMRRPPDIIEQTRKFAKPGGVILLHDTEQYTAEALDSILQDLEGNYQFVTVSELFKLPPGQRGQFFGR